MERDKILEKQFQDYQQLAKQDKNIDVASLMLNAISSHIQNQNVVSSKIKRWAYLTSIGVPPLGLFFAAKYYFSSEDDARHVANVCVVLTILGLLSYWLMAKLVFSSSGASLSQIQQITPQEIQQTLGN